jgi:uncharacterized membrane protein YqgA involved in biofilm formation
VIGTLINAGTVLVGTTLGVTLGSRLPDRVRETLMHALGLVTLLVGVSQGLSAFRPPLSELTRGAVLIVLGSVLVGGLVGELLGIERGLDRAGESLKRRFGRGEARFTEGFVVASLVFCVGPLTILGSIQEGITGDYQLLAVKALLDGFAALAFASVLGWGVGFSILTILLYQGALTLLASGVEGAFSESMIAAMSAVGGILILGISLRLLELREVRVANLLPAVILAPAAVAVLESMR